MSNENPDNKGETGTETNLESQDKNFKDVKEETVSVINKDTEQIEEAGGIISDKVEELGESGMGIKKESDQIVNEAEELQKGFVERIEQLNNEDIETAVATALWLERGGGESSPEEMESDSRNAQEFMKEWQEDPDPDNLAEKISKLDEYIRILEEKSDNAGEYLEQNKIDDYVGRLAGLRNIWEAKLREYLESSDTFDRIAETEFCRSFAEFKETINCLEKIAKKEGLKGIYIDKNKNDETVGIGVASQGVGLIHRNGKIVPIVYNRDAEKVNFDKDTLQNIKDLFETDKIFAEEEIADIIKHEKQHLEGPALTVLKKQKKEIKKMVDEEVNRNDKDMTGLASAITEKSQEIWNKYYPDSEKQAELQRIINDNFENKKDFVESEAKKHVALDIIQHGFDVIKNIKYNSETLKSYRDPHFAFIKPGIQKDIFTKMEEIRLDLISKYNEKLRAQKKAKELDKPDKNVKLEDLRELYDINEESRNKFLNRSDVELKEWQEKSEQEKKEEIENKKKEVSEKVKIEKENLEGKMKEIENSFRENIARRLAEARKLEEFFKNPEASDVEGKFDLERMKESLSNSGEFVEYLLEMEEIEYLMESEKDELGNLMETHKERDITMREYEELLKLLKEFQVKIESFERLEEEQKKEIAEGLFAKLKNIYEKNPALFKKLAAIGVIASAAVLLYAAGSAVLASSLYSMGVEIGAKEIIIGGAIAGGAGGIGALAYLYKKGKITGEGLKKAGSTLLAFPLGGIATALAYLTNGKNWDKWMERITGQKVPEWARSAEEKK
jgi:hypothetical protein